MKLSAARIAGAAAVAVLTCAALFAAVYERAVSSIELRRASSMATAGSSGYLRALGRLIAFATAWQMFKDSPVFGVGPGCFEYVYFDYFSRVYPSLLEYRWQESSTCSARLTTIIFKSPRRRG